MNKFCLKQQVACLSHLAINNNGDDNGDAGIDGDDGDDDDGDANDVYDAAGDGDV